MRMRGRRGTGGDVGVDVLTAVVVVGCVVFVVAVLVGRKRLNS